MAARPCPFLVGRGKKWLMKNRDAGRIKMRFQEIGEGGEGREGQAGGKQGVQAERTRVSFLVPILSAGLGLGRGRVKCFP